MRRVWTRALQLEVTCVALRAVGIVRQSRGREDSLSPAEQRERIEDVCGREALELLTVHEEIDVSGGTPLARREGLRAAVEAVEDGDAEVVVVAYFDRLFRSIEVQGEVVRRIEEAGGRILAADVGEIGGASAAQWISGAMLGVVSDYYRRSIRERSGAAQAKAVREGRPPYEHSVPGYDVVPNGDAGLVAELFAMRGAGASLRVIREKLADHGIHRSYSSVQRLLGNDVVLGVLWFGELVNAEAHPAIVEREVFDRVQALRSKRGPVPRSDRLLARLNVAVYGFN